MHKEQRTAHAEQAAIIVGIDSGKFKHAIAARPQIGPHAGKMIKPLMVTVTPDGFAEAEAYIRSAIPEGHEVRAEQILVGIEFGGNAGMTLAAFLVRRGFDVVSVRAVDTKQWTKVYHKRPLKTDPHDARVIADLTANGNYLGFPFLDPAYAELRHLVSAIERTTRTRTMAVNRLRGVLHIAWPEFENTFETLTRTVTPLGILAKYSSPAALLAARPAAVVKTVCTLSNGQLGEELVEQLRADAARTIALPSKDGALYAEIPLLIEQIQTATAHRTTLEELVARHVQALPEAQALITMPGVTWLTVGVLLGSLGDLRTYDVPGQAIAMAGLDLTEKSSGQHQGSVHISKHGRPTLRKYLYLVAMREVAKGRSQHERFIAAKARNGGKGKKALVGIARKMLGRMFAIARSGQPYNASHVSRRHRARPEV